MNYKRNFLVLFSLLVVFTLALAACGGGKAEPTPEPAAPTEAPAPEATEAPAAAEEPAPETEGSASYAGLDKDLSGVTIRMANIGGQPYEAMYDSIKVFEEKTGAKVDIVFLGDGFEIDKPGGEAVRVVAFAHGGDHFAIRFAGDGLSHRCFPDDVGFFHIDARSPVPRRPPHVSSDHGPAFDAQTLFDRVRQFDAEAAKGAMTKGIERRAVFRDADGFAVVSDLLATETLGSCHKTDAVAVMNFFYVIADLVQ
jgi:hypothetical protein